MIARQTTTVFIACFLLCACGRTLGGYPRHDLQPSLAAPAAPVNSDRTMYLGLIRKMQQQGAYYASLAHIDAFRLRFGDSPALRRLEADALRETGQRVAAQSIYQGLTEGTEAAAAWHGLGLIAAAEGRHAEAVQDLLKVVQLEPANVAYLSDLGYARLCSGDIAGAHEPLAEATELDPANVQAVSNLALWATLSGNESGAEEIMQRADLPQATRDAVRRSAWQLRAARSGSAANAGSPESAGAGVASPAAARPVAGIPGGLLDRLGSSTPAYKARP
ncbi:Flp pilus assembly protein TadD [Dyella sp.]|uniref:Flp pilus assembly protein TadD n=1 Tax=Dyella sp. TaxID=1869338 RepID=UPI003F823822